MNNNIADLSEKEGIWYLQGKPLRIGTPVIIEDVEWNVIGWGRSRSERQTLFIWIRNEWFGTTVYVPSLVAHKLRLNTYLKPNITKERSLTAA